MDIKTFYSRKQQECAVRDIPSECEDSGLSDSDSEGVDQEEWIPESGLRDT